MAQIVVKLDTVAGDRYLRCEDCVTRVAIAPPADDVDVAQWSAR